MIKNKMHMTLGGFFERIRRKKISSALWDL